VIWEVQTCHSQDSRDDAQVALVAMLYDKAISCLKAAIQALHGKKIEARWQYNRQAQEIINHLYTMLDLDKGGEMASNLEALYTYMLLRLPDVDIKNDARPAEEVIELLEPLRGSWKEFALNRAASKIDRPITNDAEDRWAVSTAPKRHCATPSPAPLPPK
jgi:flagellar protein FliS